MTRQITKDSVRAFLNDQTFCKSNTTVTRKDGVTSLLLWGNRIAYKQDGKLFVSLCGYNTTTTRERLNGIPCLSVCSKNFTPYINGVAVSSYKTYSIENGKVVEAL